ncbi:MAG: hypothetical protein H7257_01285 [Taibaiella sp.]|nr:hypothetical protein [Taibaiella sp.]
MVTLFFCLSISYLYAQPPFRQTIETDTSNIEIIRNSVYRVYEETYKYKDSVWYSVSFIDDTTQLNTEGWMSKDGEYWGVWKEYNRTDQLMYTWDHDQGTCKVNPKLYPFYKLLEKMKITADNIITDAYGREFLREHVKFNFDFYAYHGHRDKFGDDTLWTEDYLGSWTEPLKSRPNSYLLRYEVRLNKKDKHFIELGICLDSNGKYFASTDDFWNNYGFERVKSNTKKFVLNKDKAIFIAKQKGLVVTDSTDIKEFLTWENFKKKDFYNGRFVYYISNLRRKDNYERPPDRKGIIFRYDVYCFNPWTGEFIEVKKMKSRKEYGKDSGHSTGLVPDND